MNKTKLSNVEVYYPNGMEYREPSGNIPNTKLNNHFEGAVVAAISPYLKSLEKNKTKYVDYSHPDYVVHVPMDELRFLRNIPSYDKAIKELNNIVRKEVIRQAIIPHLSNTSDTIKSIFSKNEPLTENLSKDYPWISPQSQNAEGILADMLNYIHLKYNQNRDQYYPDEDDYIYDPYKKMGIFDEKKVPAAAHFSAYIKTLKPNKISSHPLLKQLFDAVQEQLS